MKTLIFLQYIPLITYWYLPLLIFQIFYGTYIYRHFYSASVYFFSSYCSRTLCFLKETGVLYLFGLAYLIVMILSGAFITNFFTLAIADTASWLLACYYFLIHSLFLLITTLGINILAIVFTSNVGFIIIGGVSLFSMVSFEMLGKYFITQDDLIDKYTWMLKINPIANLMLNMHSSGIRSVGRIINTKSISFVLNLSVLVFLMAAIIVTVCGCMVLTIIILLNPIKKREEFDMELVVNNVSKQIKNRTILSNIKRRLTSGMIYGFVGPNGSGKTMLFRAISGLIKPSSGGVWLEGKLLHRDMKVMSNLGIVIENAGLYPGLPDLTI